MKIRRALAALLTAGLLLGVNTSMAAADESETVETTVSAHTAGTKPVGLLTNTWGWVDPAEDGQVVWTEVLLASGWSRSQVRQTDENGYFVIPLTYGANAVGEYQWRVGTQVDGATVHSDPFTLQRTAGVVARSAGTKPVGLLTNTWGTVQGAPAGTTVWTEVRLASGWSRSQTRTTDAKGYFVIPLTYGSTTPGTYTWRVGARLGGATIHSAPFELRRDAGVTARSAGTKYVGEATNTWGTVHGAPAGTTVWTEVRLASGWSRSQTRTTDAKGYFVIPLTYGSTTPGTYTWRVGARLGGATIHSAPFELKRNARATTEYRPTVCDMVKGNINAQGEKIYHVPGGALYNRTVIDYSAGERCFRTASEARQAGWRASQR